MTRWTEYGPGDAETWYTYCGDPNDPRAPDPDDEDQYHEPNMNIENFISRYDPCSDSRQFLRSCSTLQDAWEKCERSDWMLWALAHIYHISEREDAALAAAFVRRTPIDDGGRYVSDLLTDQRSIRFLEMKEEFAETGVKPDGWCDAELAARDATTEARAETVTQCPSWNAMDAAAQCSAVYAANSAVCVADDALTNAQSDADIHAEWLVRRERAAVARAAVRLAQSHIIREFIPTI